MVAPAAARISGVPERASKPSAEPQQVDAAGQAILNLLHKATSITEANNRRAMEEAEELLHRLRAAEERIACLQSEAQFYRDRLAQAENWLDRISGEIERRFYPEALHKRIGQ